MAEPAEIDGDDATASDERPEPFFASLKGYEQWTSALRRPAWTFDYPKSWRWLRDIPVGMSRGYTQDSVARYIAGKMITVHRGALIVETLRYWNTANAEQLTDFEIWQTVRAAHHAAKMAGTVR